MNILKPFSILFLLSWNVFGGAGDYKCTAEEFLAARSHTVLDQITWASEYKSGQKLYTWQKPYEIVPHKVLGYGQRPSSTIRHIKRTSDKILYDVVYHFDELGRRVNPIDDTEDRNKFIILHGCSFTYGNGLNDDETLSYFMTSLSRNHYVYNYAIGASGPNMMLAQLLQGNMRGEIRQEKGVFFYVYIDDHLQRANGFLQQYPWMKETPFFRFSNGQIKKLGSLKSARPRWSWFLELLDRMNYSAILGQNFPRINSDHVEYICQLIGASRDEFKRQFEGSDFYLVVHPLSEINADVVKCLQAKKVKILNDFNLKKTELDEYRIPFDGHPTKEFNLEFSSLLLQKISN